MGSMKISSLYSPLTVIAHPKESLNGTPFWVFVDADGTVAVRLSGAVGPEVLTSVLTDLSR